MIQDKQLIEALHKLICASNHLPVFPKGTDFTALSADIKTKIKNEATALKELCDYIENNYTKN